MKREDRKARSIAANLQTVIEPGDRVLLILPASLDYALAFIGLYTPVRLRCRLWRQPMLAGSLGCSS
jgi:hypothetical protein